VPEIDKAGGASPATEQAEERTCETRDFMWSVCRVCASWARVSRVREHERGESRAATDHLVVDCRNTFANGAVDLPHRVARLYRLQSVGSFPRYLMHWRNVHLLPMFLNGQGTLVLRSPSPLYAHALSEANKRTTETVALALGV